MRRLFHCRYIRQYPVQARAGLRVFADLIRHRIRCFKTIRELNNAWVTVKVDSQVNGELNRSVERLPSTNCISRYTKVGVARLNCCRLNNVLVTLHEIPHSTNKLEAVIHLKNQYLRVRELIL